MPKTVLMVQPQRGEKFAGIERAIQNISAILTTLGIRVQHDVRTTSSSPSERRTTYVIAHEPLASDDIDMFYCHTFLCAGSKLFRDTNTVCTHVINSRCPLDWYFHRCGCCKSPLEARRLWVRAANIKSWLAQGTFDIGVASHWMAQYLKNEGIDPRRLILLPLAWSEGCGADANWEARRQVTYIGRLSYQKGVQLLPILSTLIPDIGIDVFGEGYMSEPLRHQITSAGATASLRLRGSLPFSFVTNELLRTAVLLAPSLCPEPYGLSVSEARHAGAWVLATERGAMPEWAAIDPGVQLVDYSRPQLAAQVIRSCIHTPPPPPPDYGSRSLAAWQAWWDRCA